jgi:uncharacterized membrane protein YqiK
MSGKGIFMLELGIIAGSVLVGLLVLMWLVFRYTPNEKVTVVERLWSSKGSLGEGDIIAMNGQAGFDPEVVRGGMSFGYWRWQYRFHKMSMITIKQGKIGYIFSRVGKPLQPGQTLARVVSCNDFQNVQAFLEADGQKGRQRAILREGVYAINLAAFSVITEDAVYSVVHDTHLLEWRQSLINVKGFDPVVVGSASGHDNVAIVTIHDGPSLSSGEIIAPEVGGDKDDPNYHNNYQDTEKFLAAGGHRGLQYVPLTDGTYFINRWFASVEYKDKQVVPIGYVGVVVSYYGKAGIDTSGSSFRHGERVHEGERGVWEKTLGPGKYPFNPYAGNIVLVPTTNFVLHWITGRTETHKYDDTLRSIELITKDAYEPQLPLSVVVHIDYQKAPNVIQRFGDVKQLITQTIDPMLSAYFRDVAHSKTMLELVHSRDDIQKQAREELSKKFAAFDIQCVDVLIGKPDSANDDGKIENLLDQLRQRQLSLEQIETFSKQEQAAGKRQTLEEAVAKAAMQTSLTQSKVKIEINTNEADAELQRAKKDAEKTVVLAEARSRQSILEGKGDAEKIQSIGAAEADVLRQKIASFGDSQLYALSVIASSLSQSKQPLVPSIVSGAGDGKGSNMLDVLLTLLVSNKTGVVNGLTHNPRVIETSDGIKLETLN